jgi:YHS domain-containing protein
MKLWSLPFLLSPFLALADGTANLNSQGVILCSKGTSDCYDPVSYFHGGGPLKGRAELKTEVHGVTYYFSSKENQQEFLKDPKKYEPQYEGWCATAVAKGKKYAIDPLNYEITNGRLFLFYRESGLFGGDAKPEWVKNELENTQKADTNWPKVRLEKQ